MSFSSSSKENISLKKLVGKAHTSNSLDFFNESKSSGITINSDAVMAETLPTSPTNSNLYDITSNVVELVRLVATPLPESIVDGKFHGFKLSLPADYTTDSSNPKGGSGSFVNSQDVYDTNGALQLVPPSFSDSYEAKLFYGGTSAKNSGTRIPLLDNRNWYLDYFNGILFQENPPADANENPDFVEVFIYIGKMASERFSEGTGEVNEGAASLDELSDVTITGGSDGHILVRNNGGQYVNRLLTANDLTTPLSTTSITSLTDVHDITGIQNGNVLAWSAANNRFEFSAPAVTYTDENAQDAAASLLTAGTHTGIAFTYNDDDNDIDAVVSLTGFSIGDLSNVDITTNAPTANQVLKWNGVDKFVPGEDTGKSTEEIQDIVGGMVDGGTETGISVSYDDVNGRLDFTVSLSGFSINDLNDVNTAGIADDKILKFSGGSLIVADNTGKTVEEIQDIVGAMASSNTETGISVTYQDDDGTLDFEVDSLTVGFLAGDQTFTGNKTFTGDVDLTGASVTGETKNTSDNSTSLATTAYVDSQIDSDIAALDLANVYQVKNDRLDDISALGVDNNHFVVGNGTDLVLESPTDAIVSLGLGASQHQLLIGDTTQNTFTTIATTANLRTFLASEAGLGNLSDVTLGGIGKAEGQILRISADNSTFVNAQLSFSDLSDTATIVKTDSAATFGDFLYNFTGSTITVPTPTEDAHASTKKYVDDELANKQPIDDTLTALAGLNTAADQIIYSTGVDSFAMSSLTTNARTFLSTSANLSDITNVTVDSISDAHILVYDGAVNNRWNNVALSGALTITNSGVVTLSDNSVTNAKIQNSFINLTDGSNTDKLNLGEILTFAGTANEIELSTTSDVNGENAGATITIGLPNDVTIGNNLIVTGNLTVNGTTTTIDTDNLNVKDTIITLNSGIAGANSNDIGLFFDRGDSNPALFVWDEGEDLFKLGTHTGVIDNTISDVSSVAGFTLETLHVKTPDAASDDNSVATTEWVNDNTVSDINSLSDVDTTGKADGKILKFNAAGNLVVADDDSGSGFTADTSTLWDVSDDGTELFPHGIIDGTLDTGMFAINLSAGNLNYMSSEVTLHDILEELSSMNAYTPSTRDQADISDTFFEFDANGDIMPKEAS